MRTPARLALTAAAATILATGGVAVADAATTNASAAGPASAAAKVAGRHLTATERHTLRSTGHLAVQRQTKKHGLVHLDIRFGKVTAASPTSITVVSKDGTSGTFALKASTKIRSKGKPTTVKSGNRVLVIATADGTARRVRVRHAATAANS